MGGNCGIVDVSRTVLSRGTSGWLDERRGSSRGSDGMFSGIIGIVESSGLTP